MLPNPDISFTPFDPLSASQLNDLVENIESLSDGSGLNDGIITNALLSTAAGEPGGEWQSHSASATGWSSTTVKVVQYIKIGKTVTLAFRISGTSNSTSASINLPFTAKSVTNLVYEQPLGTQTNNGAVSTTNGLAQINVISGSTDTLSFLRDSSGATWSSSGTKEVRGMITYECE